MTTLTMKDEKRIGIIQRGFREELTVMEAAMVLGVSERQCYRIKARVKEQGVKGKLIVIVKHYLLIWTGASPSEKSRISVVPGGG